MVAGRVVINRCVRNMVASCLALALGFAVIGCQDKTPQPQESDPAVMASSEAPSNDSQVASIPVETSMRKPNVIWIILDGCRAKNLSCYGYRRPTSPNLDGLAKRGVLFEQHFSQSVRTCTSVPSYLTGKYFPIHCLGLRFSDASIIRECPDEVLFPVMMKENGYATAMFSNSTLFRPTDRLWKSFHDVKTLGPGEKCIVQRFDVLNDTLFSWIDAHAQDPFFVYIHSLDTHFPHEMIPPYDQWIDPAFDQSKLLPKRYGQGFERPDGQPFSDADKAYITDLYDGFILDADAQIGRLLDKLTSAKLLENTLLVVTADHGQILGEDGKTVAHGTSYDEDLHIPLIIAGPGVPENKRVGFITENTDIVPTLRELLALKSPAAHDGVSLTSCMQDPNAAAPHPYVFAAPRRDFRNYESPASFVLRTSDYKYEYSLANGVSSLWRLPDSVLDRLDVKAQFPEVAAGLEKRMHEERMPLFQKFLSLPVRAVVLEAAFIPAVAEPKDAVIDKYMVSEKGEPDALCRDNKWAYTEGRLWCRGAQEQCPPLKIPVSLPNGRYTLLAAVLNTQDLHGEPASAFRIKAGQDVASKLIVADDLAPDQAIYQPLPVGEYEVTNNHIDITLEQADSQHWSALAALMLMPVVPGQPIPESASPWYDLDTPENRSDTEQMLKGIGYL